MAQSICGRVLYGIGRLRWFSRAVMLEALANLLLSVALARPLGVEGVALGTALPNVIANLAVAVYVCRALRVGVVDYGRQAFLKPAALAAGLAAFWLAAVAWAPPTDWRSLIVTGIVGLAAYVGGAALLEFGPAALGHRVRAALGGPLPAPVGVGTASPGEGSP
jgi:O-antigen/teichoic acid export membrane protein